MGFCPVKMVGDYIIRPMGREDIAGVMEIEEETFPTPWNADLFLEEMEREFSFPLVAAGPPGFSLGGYIIFWVVYDECHILNIAVRSSMRRKGLGLLLMKRCESISLDRGAAHACLEVRERNEAAIELYRKLGYRFMGLRQNYYVDTGENAWVMIKSFPGEE